MLYDTRARLMVIIDLLFGLIPIKFKFGFSQAQFYLFDRKGGRRVLFRLADIGQKPRKRQIKFVYLLKGVALKSAAISGRIGIDGDVMLTLFIIGLINVIFDCVVSIFVASNNKLNRSSCVSPDFERTVLRLNLESILIFKLEQIIYAALKHMIRGGHNSIASNRKHHEVNDGTAKSYGGR
ncbi:hypothetical protein SDC9_162607 [bioreactor metagenome]|uniref:Uncharacterized protein n=1 Tax=bioreactor metagenome TaxID=1076179 RepID=A0A645FLI7_9ZZZZ